MPRELLILRHGKSDWKAPYASDFDRPLSKRGRKAASAMGRWMKEQGLIPDAILTSPAKRAKKTARRVLKKLDLPKDLLEEDHRLYLGNLVELLSVLADAPREARRVLLVGHNPGLEELLAYLCQERSPSPDGKLLPTAALARIALPDDWQGLRPHQGKLLALIRPADIA